ncbi:MAG: YciI family protein [Actinomycetota bacterium]
MAKFLLTLWEDQSTWAQASPEDMQKQYQAYQDLTDEMRSRGAFVAGEGVKPADTAKTVRVRKDKVDATDGPFAETKEQLGGFYVIEARDEDEAIEWAAKVPAAATGAIDVRPVIDYPPEG